MSTKNLLRGESPWRGENPVYIMGMFSPDSWSRNAAEMIKNRIDNDILECIRDSPLGESESDL